MNQRYLHSVCSRRRRRNLFQLSTHLSVLRTLPPNNKGHSWTPQYAHLKCNLSNVKPHAIADMNIKHICGIAVLLLPRDETRGGKARHENHWTITPFAVHVHGGRRRWRRRWTCLGRAKHDVPSATREQREAQEEIGRAERSHAAPPNGRTQQRDTCCIVMRHACMLIDFSNLQVHESNARPPNIHHDIHAEK